LIIIGLGPFQAGTWSREQIASVALSGAALV
jgi:hypothetical protein